ncbi:MAG: ABC transporter substrate-binding protein [Chloroflexi bacterium]|nr:ABC transporter substrate-binding protein [Chloroflexota bacterium]
MVDSYISKRLLLVVALLIAAMMMVAACGGDGDDGDSGSGAAAPQTDTSTSTTTTTDTSTTAAAEPTAAPAMTTEEPAMMEPVEDRVVTAFEAPSTEGNETRHIGQTTVWQLKPMYEYLLDSHPVSDEMIPGLATEWAVEEGPQVRFKLREGVQFHDDWGEFTSADVVHTLMNHQREGGLHGELVYFQTVTPEAVVVSDYEVIIKLSRNDSNFFAQFSRLQGGFEIISKAHHEAEGDPVVIGEDDPIAGTGSYQYLEREQALNIVFERTPDHWRFSPDFPELEIKFINEASTRLAALFTGEVHLTNLPEDNLQQAVADGYGVVRGNVTALRAFAQFRGQYEDEASAQGTGYQDTGSPFLDVRVRQALNRAINRDEINSAYFGDKGVLMQVNHLNPGRPGWNERWVQEFPAKYGFDPDAAQALLAEAGYDASNPLEIDINVAPLSRYAGADDIIEIMAGYWSDIGVKVNQYTEDTATRRARGRNFEYTREIAMGGTSSNITIGPKVYNTSFPPRGGGVEILESSRIMGEFIQTLDPVKADALARQMGDIFFDQFISIPLFWLPAEAVINKEVIAGWVWPGSITGTWTHLENIEAVKK